MVRVIDVNHHLIEHLCSQSEERGLSDDLGVVLRVQIVWLGAGVAQDQIAHPNLHPAGSVCLGIKPDRSSKTLIDAGGATPEQRHGLVTVDLDR